MIPKIQSSEFEEQALTCPECGWTGKGQDANIIDFYGVVAEKEVHCPSCDATIGTIREDDDEPPGISASD